MQRCVAFCGWHASARRRSCSDCGCPARCGPCSWGYLSRAGVNDKSQLMRQIEKYAGERQLQPELDGGEIPVGNCPGISAPASFHSPPRCAARPLHRADIFTSRVSNFLRYTPFEYFRSVGAAPCLPQAPATQQPCSAHVL